MDCSGYILVNVNILHKSDDYNKNKNNNNNTYIFGHCMRPYSSKYNPGSRVETLLGLFYLIAKLVIFLCQIW